MSGIYLPKKPVMIRKRNVTPVSDVLTPILTIPGSVGVNSNSNNGLRQTVYLPGRNNNGVQVVTS